MEGKKIEEASQGSIAEMLKSLDGAANTITTISDNLKQLFESVLASSELYSYVCGIDKLTELEGSVGETDDVRHPEIFVRSTLFKLETTDKPFERMLINNLRKGVTYNYLIPSYSNPHEYKAFNDMVMDWWESYSVFLVNEEELQKVYRQKAKNWDSKYVNYLDKAKTFYETPDKTHKWEDLTKKLFELFKERLKVFTADECAFYTVTALYQVGRNEWKAIEKLPTEYINPNITGYYSFVVFGKGTADNQNPFVKKFKDNFTNQYDTAPLFNTIQESFGERIYAAHAN